MTTQHALFERSTNIPMAMKSPSKVPLPPSPQKTRQSAAPFAQETGPMDDVFKASTLSQKPDLIRQLTEAHLAGQTYVSPSDNIQSPTTKKLSQVKGRRLANLKKSSSLYKASNIFAHSNDQDTSSPKEVDVAPSRNKHQ